MNANEINDFIAELDKMEMPKGTMYWQTLFRGLQMQPNKNVQPSK